MLVKTTRYLEANPLTKDAKDIRAWAVTFVIEAPDVSVVVCGLIGPLLDKKPKYGSELTAQYTIGMAAFKIENSDKANSENAAQQAGVESMLKAYQSILKEKPKETVKFLDDLIQKRDKGELTKFVEDSNCGKK
jgi:hypothetical protein